MPPSPPKATNLHFLVILPCRFSERYAASTPQTVAAAFSKALWMNGRLPRGVREDRRRDFQAAGRRAADDRGVGRGQYLSDYDGDGAARARAMSAGQNSPFFASSFRFAIVSSPSSIPSRPGS